MGSQQKDDGLAIVGNQWKGCLYRRIENFGVLSCGRMMREGDGVMTVG